MTEADIQIIVQEVMRRMFNEPGVMNATSGANGLPARDTSTLDERTRQISSMAASTADATISTVVTRNDIVEFAKAGKKRLVVLHGGLVTPLARDLAAEHGLEIVWAAESASNSHTSFSSGGRQPESSRVHTHGTGQTALTCLRCSSCLEPAFYERALRDMEQTTTRVLGELRVYIQNCWIHEPADIETLRSVSRPPMGNLPCCFYANFNLFWAGENLQVCRQMVKDNILPVQVVGQIVAGLLERHAARLEKWSMNETVALERMLAQYFKGKGPANSEEFLAVIEHALIALDRVQSWIDGLLPWNELDAHLALRRPISVM